MRVLGLLVGGGPEGWKCRGSGAGKDRWMGGAVGAGDQSGRPYIYTKKLDAHRRPPAVVDVEVNAVPRWGAPSRPRTARRRTAWR